MKKRKNSTKILYKAIGAVLFSSMILVTIGSLSGGYQKLVHNTPMPRTVRGMLVGSLHIPLLKLYFSQKDINENAVAEEGVISLCDTTVYQYDGNGNNIHWYQYDKSGWLSDYANSYYDSHGTLICEQKYDIWTGEEMETLYDNHYDEKGRIMEQTVYQDGKISLFKTFQYRDQSVITASSGAKSGDTTVMISTEDGKRLCEYVYEKDAVKKNYLYQCYDGRGRDLLQVSGYGPTDDHLAKALYTQWDDSFYTNRETLYVPGDSGEVRAFQQNRYTEDWQQVEGVRCEYNAGSPYVTDTYQAGFFLDEETGGMNRSHEIKFDKDKVEYFRIYQYRDTRNGRVLTTKFSYEMSNNLPKSTLEHYEYDASGALAKKFKYNVDGDFTLTGTNGSRKIGFYDSGKLRSFVMEEDSEGIVEEYEFHEDGTVL